MNYYVMTLFPEMIENGHAYEHYRAGDGERAAYADRRSISGTFRHAETDGSMTIRTAAEPAW